MSVVYVAGAQPGAGATATAAALATLWRRAGRRVALVKPTALDGGASDARLFDDIDGTSHPTPVQPGELDQAAKAVEAAASQADVVLVEGLPLLDGDGQATQTGELARLTGGTVVGVEPYSSASAGDVAARWRDAFGDALAGLVVNRLPRYAGHDGATVLSPGLEAAGVATLALVPEDRRMLAPTVRQLADHLDATFFTWPSEDGRLVEHLLIGGLIMEWGGNYFGRFEHQAVIVRGGRTDIQMSALNFPMSCLVLTGCTEPPQYVYQRARAEEVPLMVVERGTMEVAAALESIHERVSVHHAAKVERFAQLLESRADAAVLDRVASLG